MSKEVRLPSVKDRYIAQLENEIARVNLEINEFKRTVEKLVKEIKE